jgi:hypothetical protein
MKKLLILFLALPSLVACDLGGEDLKRRRVGQGIISDQDLIFIPYLNGMEWSPENANIHSPRKFDIQKGKHNYSKYLGAVDFMEGEDPRIYLGSQFYYNDSILIVKADFTSKLVFISPFLDDSTDYKLKKEITIWKPINWYHDKKNKVLYYTISEAYFEEFGEKMK